MPNATLGGVTLSGQAPIVWRLQPGVDPYSTVIWQTKHRAQQLLAMAGQPLLLQLGKLTVRDVFVLHEVPSDNPSVQGVLITDRRWLWERAHVCVDFNIPRKTGTFGRFGTRLEVFTPAPHVKYIGYSTKNGQAWSPQQAIEEVLRQIFDYEREQGITAPRVTRISNVPKMEVQGIALEGRGNTELKRLLAHLPGMQVALNAEGVISVYQSTDRSEDAVLAKLRAGAHTGSAVPKRINRERFKPSAIEVRFVTEMEVKGEFIESETLSNQTYHPGRTRTRNPFNLRNVAPCPDARLNLTGHTAGIGDWVPFDSLIDAWAGQPVLSGIPVPAFTNELIRKHFMSSFEKIKYQYMLGAAAPDPVWEARWETILHHWRQTFQLDINFRSKVKQWAANRALIADSATAARYTAMVYCDYSIRPYWKAYAAEAKGVKYPRTEQGWAIRGYDGDLNDAQAVAPFKVEMIDHEAGVFRLIPKMDPWGLGSGIAPGFIEKVNIPGMPSLFNAHGGLQHALWEHCELEPGWSVAVIFAVTPGEPNDTRRMTPFFVSPQDAEQTLGYSLGSCLGPVVQVSVLPELMTAQYVWDENRRTEAIDRFLNGAFAGSLLNNTKQLRDMANAIGARVYQTVLDGERTTGAVEVDLKPELDLTGRLAMIEHTLEPSGQLVTRTMSVNQVQLLDVWPLLPDSTRRIAQRLVDYGGY